MTADDPLDVVLAGGGAAALEALMALRDLAGDRGRLALVAPEPEFELKAFRTVEPFAVGHVRRRTMRAFADRFGADLRRDSIARVDPEGRVVELTSGDQLAYDELVLAVGARARPAHRHAITFGMEPRSDELWLMLREIGSGIVRSVAFVVPSQTSWLHPGRRARRRRGHRSRLRGRRRDRLPVKQGGLECQQADAVAEHIAARVVTGLEPRPFRAVLRGKLLKGRGAAYLRRGPGGDGGGSEAAGVQLWSRRRRSAGGICRGGSCGTRRTPTSPTRPGRPTSRSSCRSARTRAPARPQRPLTDGHAGGITRQGAAALRISTSPADRACRLRMPPSATGASVAWMEPGHGRQDAPDPAGLRRLQLGEARHSRGGLAVRARRRCRTPRVAPAVARAPLNR